jgi:hypothetical protein
MNLGSLHRIWGKGIQKFPIIDSNRLHTCHDHRWNGSEVCLGVVFCAKNEACYVVIKGLIPRQIFMFASNQLLIGFVWIHPLVNIYISRRIQSFKHSMRYLLVCQRHWLAFILLLRDNNDLSKLRMQGLRQRRRWLSCRGLFCKWWYEGWFWWPHAHCFPGWSPKRLIVRLWIITSTIIVIVGYRAGIVIKIHVGDWLSATPGAGRERRRRSAVPSCHNLEKRRVISTETKVVTKWNVNECRVNELKRYVKKGKCW